MSQMKDNNKMQSESNPSLILTPECQNLWFLSPKQLLLYDNIIIDEIDLHKLQNPKKDTHLSAMKSRSAEKLLQWGYLTPENYRDKLKSSERNQISRIAKKIVHSYLPRDGEAMGKSKFYSLSVYTHEKYAEYLEESIMACPSQDEDFQSHIHRLNSVEGRLKRLKTMDIDDNLCEELQWTLERIAAKAVAGLVISRRFGVTKLYDTAEYIPFIQDAFVESLSDMTIFEPEKDLPVIKASVAALSKKSLPDVSIFDEQRLFSAIREKAEFERARKLLRHIEQIFGEMLVEHTDTVRKKIALEIERLTMEFNERMDEAKKAFSEQAKWVSIEMVAGQVAGFLSPWIERAKKASDNEKLNNISELIIDRNDLASDLFFLMEIWKRYRVLDDERYRKTLKENNEHTIWGQENEDLPWYER